MLGVTPAFGDATLTDCDREPIHIPGSIQPHGVLLGLCPQQLTIRQFAGDTEGLLGLPADQLLGRVGLDCFDRPAALRLQDHLSTPQPVSLPTVVFDLGLAQPGKPPVDAVIHRSGTALLVELESAAAPPAGLLAREPVDPLAMVQGMVTRLQETGSCAALCRMVAEEVREATGFDRVMIYRFLPDGCGSVIAESRDPEVESFLGLHYPASDIPVQARTLYRRNWLRLIPDARYRPMPLVPSLDPQSGAPLDLTHSVLRSVSPIHLKYLANMGVAASLSLSIVIRGRLWGLIACHHRTPRLLGSRLRAACALFAQFVSLQLEVRIAVDHSRDRDRIYQMHESLVQAMSAGDSLAASLIGQSPNLLDYIAADGVATWVDGRIGTLGQVPTADQINQLISWFSKTIPGGVFATDHLAAHYPEAQAFADSASGVLMLSVSREPRDYILWFRKEMVRTIDWAGDPSKPVAVEPGADRLGPRTSFAAWRQSVRYHAQPWQDFELDAAHALRVSILEVILHRIDQLSRERERARTEQNILMAELDHRVKNTIATIQALVQHSSVASQDTLANFVLSFNLRLQAMAKAHNLLSQGRWKGVSLRSLIEEEIAPHQRNARFDITGPHVILRPKAALAMGLALHELVTNASKYGPLSLATGTITVRWSIDPVPAEDDGERYLAFRWVERGGPPVVAPARRGFGRTLLERVFAFEVDGKATLRFAPEGLVAVFQIPISQVIAEDGPMPLRSPTPAAPIPAATLQGTRVLVVEDSALVAMEVQVMLEKHGAEVVGPVGRLARAVKTAQEESFQVALLDVDLDGQMVWEVADVLAVRRIPFAFTTGFEASLVVPTRFAEVPVVMKPYRTHDLPTLLLKLLGRA